MNSVMMPPPPMTTATASVSAAASATASAAASALTTATTNTTNTTSTANTNSTSSRNSIISKSKRVHREVRFGAYVLGSTLGEGEFGKVKLGWRKDGKQPSQTAIKLIRRESIPKGSERESKVHREINALKRLAHPNIVRLEEVLQNDKYIGIVLEYASGGELFDYILEHRYLKDSMACRLFAQLVSGVDYMHSKGIVHRDLKLENLLLDKHKNIVITDFGFVNSFRSGDELMKTSCGSPCYAAPELVVSSEPYEARKVDVWSCGVILYAMLSGYLPFDDDPQNPDGDNIARLYHYITHTPLTFPEYIQPMPRDLLRKIIVSEPKKRISLKEVRSHSWLSPHAPFLSVTPVEWDRNYRSVRSTNNHQHGMESTENRRYSLMERPSTAGTSSSSQTSSTRTFVMQPHHGRSYSTQNVSNKLYANPAAPQTSSSHAVVMPTSASSHEIYSLSSSSQQHLTSSTPNTANMDLQSLHSVTPSSIYAKNHHHNTKPAQMSSASIALQAVVQADVVERRNSLSSSGSTNGEFNLSSYSGGNIFAKSFGAPRPTSIYDSGRPTNNSAISLSNIDETPSETQQDGNGISSSLIKPTASPNVMPPPPKTSSSTRSNTSARLPGPHVKPRPTSYHPGSYKAPGSSNDIFSLAPFNLNGMPNRNGSVTSNPSIKRQHDISEDSSQITATTTPKISQESIMLSSPSSTKEKRNSWSKISEPHVDMSIANGMLSPTDKTEKRKSVALDSLSNTIDLFSLSSADVKEPLKDGQERKNSAEKLVQETQQQIDFENKHINIQKQDEKMVIGEIETIKLQQQGLQVNNIINLEGQDNNGSTASKHISGDDNIISTGASETISKGSKLSNEKENAKPPGGLGITRPKRFSFFYASSNSSTNIVTPNITSKDRNISDASKSKSSTSSAGSRKILEPSNDYNVIKNNNTSNNATVDIKKQNRMSIAAPGNKKISSNSSTTNNKEVSAAKKVMDFFKRRSMRI